MSKRFPLFLLAAAVLLVLSPAVRAQTDPGDPPYCPSRLSSSEPFSQIILLNNQIPVRKVGDHYEVFFTLVNEKTYNPDGACNTGDTVVKLSTSANIWDAQTVIPAGANPLVQRSVLIWPSNPNSQTFYCFKLKYHTSVNDAWKRRGAANLPALNDPIWNTQSLVYITLQDC